jgi:hypothetical protein
VSKKSRGRSAPNPGWFPKGRSGNLKASNTSKGRARPDARAFRPSLTVPDRGGGTREITVEEALQLRTYQDALAGKRMAMREVMKWIIKREAWLEKHEPEVAESGSELFTDDPDNADAALVLLGIAGPNPARADFRAKRAQLLLEPWAVQAALRRRRGGQRLTKHELDDVRRCTRDPHTLRWPRGTGR